MSIQSLFKIAVNMPLEGLTRGIYKGIDDAYRGGKKMRSSFERGFNSSSKKLINPIGSVGNITASTHALLKKNIDQKISSTLKELDAISNQALIASLKPKYRAEFSRDRSRFAELTALNNYRPFDLLQSPNTLNSLMGMNSLRMLSTLPANSLEQIKSIPFFAKALGYNTPFVGKPTSFDNFSVGTYQNYQGMLSPQNYKNFIIPNKQNEMMLQAMNDVSRNTKSFLRVLEYRPTVATQRGLNAGNPIFNRALGYPIGSFFGSPLGMGVSGAALAAHTMWSYSQKLADRDTLYRQLSAYIKSDNQVETFNKVLRTPLENVAREYALGVDRLSEYVLKALKSGFSVENIANSLDSVGKVSRAYNLSTDALSEIIVMGSKLGYVDINDDSSINKYMAKLIAMVQNSKMSLTDYSNMLGYAQGALQVPGMTDTDFMAIAMGLGEGNILATRAGRGLGQFFAKLMTPDTKADLIDAELVNILRQDGVEFDSKQLKNLSDYFAGLGFSPYDKDGTVDVGEGKKYASWTDALVDLGKRIEDSEMTEADFQKMGGEFGRIAGRTFLTLYQNLGKLPEFRDSLVSAESTYREILDSVVDLSNTGIGKARDNIRSSMEQLSGSFLKLEESTGFLESSLSTIAGTIDWISDRIRQSADKNTVKDATQETMLMIKLLDKVLYDLNTGRMDSVHLNMLPEEWQALHGARENIKVQDILDDFVSLQDFLNIGMLYENRLTKQDLWDSSFKKMGYGNKESAQLMKMTGDSGIVFDLSLHKTEASKLWSEYGLHQGGINEHLIPEYIFPGISKTPNWMEGIAHLDKVESIALNPLFTNNTDLMSFQGMSPFFLDPFKTPLNEQPEIIIRVLNNAQQQKVTVDTNFTNSLINNNNREG
ncbi:MAG: phage tail tape measure protein [Brevinema sp.]